MVAAAQDPDTISTREKNKLEWKDYPGLSGLQFVTVAGNPSGN